MLTLLSPAKKLLPSFEPYLKPTTEPVMIKQANALAKIMKTKSAAQIADLMDLSEDLASLNFHRFQDFYLRKSAAVSAYPGLWMFQGDVYQGLQAATWTSKTVDYSQQHLRILSGLYGLLKPLDLIQAYRLEMGVRLSNPKGDNLYDFWRGHLLKALNQELASQKNPLLINLASQEYFKAVEVKKLKYPVITINFYEKKGKDIKMIGIFSKKARGTMAKFIMENQIDDLDTLKTFSELGYQLMNDNTAAGSIDFMREI